MKKISILFMAMAMTIAASAQLSIGAKAGINYSTFRGSDAEGAKGKIGFHAGVAGELSLGNIAFAPELLFSSQGVKADELEADDLKLNVSYVQVPLLARYKFESGFFIEAGVQPGFLMQAKIKGDEGSASIKDSYKKTDLSVPFGAGFQTSSGIGINARYNLGLSKLDKEGEGKVYNSVAQLSVTYRLFGK